MWQLSGLLSKPQKGLGLAAAMGLIEVDRGGEFSLEKKD